MLLNSAAGKDTVIFVEKDDHQKPAEVKFEVVEAEEPGETFHCLGLDHPHV